jgi:hypothetical protein
METSTDGIYWMDKIIDSTRKASIFFIGEIDGPIREQHPADVMEVMMN